MGIRLLPIEHSDLGPYCLQYRIPKQMRAVDDKSHDCHSKEQMTKVVTAGLIDKDFNELITHNKLFVRNGVFFCKFNRTGMINRNIG